jgi:BirA family biotin operon repressor/biotin-[acetyl-CoA-carboxylase] ligase
VPAQPPPADGRTALDADGLDPAGWSEIRVVEVTGSTNADLLALAAAGEPAGLVLVAEEQTAGRGRLDRTWTAPPRSALTLSVLLRPLREPAAAGWLPLLAGLAVAEAVRGVTGLDVRLKWPNDLLVGPAKLGGLLAERASGAVVVGIGLNVTSTAAELPGPDATSVALAGSTPPDRSALLVAVLGRLAQRLAAWDVPPGPGRTTADHELRAAYLAACSTLGRQVRVSMPAGTVDGLAADVDERGCLVVFTAGGPQPIAAGDVLHVR